MEGTTALKTTFGMVSYLIGPKNWQDLLRKLEVFPANSFELTMEKLEKVLRKVSERVWSCLMHWRLSQGTNATVERVIGSLHSIGVHWLALSVQKHLELSGYIISDEEGHLTCEQCAKRLKVVTPASTSYPIDISLSGDNKPTTPASETVASTA